MHPLVRHWTAVVACALLCGCGPIVRPPSTPMDRTGIFERIAVEGGTVVSVTSGDPGCDVPTLAANAVRIRVRAPDGSESDVHLLTFRNRRFWEASAADSDACIRDLAARSAVPATDVERLDVSPYRAWGVDWSPALSDLLSRALTTAAGGGG